MKCEICGKECKSFVSLSGHITKKHGIKSEDYYIKYLKKDINESKCLTCGKKTTFLGLKIGYQKFCSSKCAQNNPSIRQKIEGSCLIKFGVTTNLLNPNCMQKIKDTMIKNHGVNNIFKNVKYIKECISKKLGVDNPAKLPKTIKKRENTCLIKYGDKSPNRIKSVQKKKEKTNILHHGVKCPFQSPKIQKIIRQIHIKKYGVDHYSKTQKFKELAGLNMIKRMESGFKDPHKFTPIKGKNEKSVFDELQIYCPYPLLEDQQIGHLFPDRLVKYVKLVIEYDEGHHLEKWCKKRDKIRDKFFKSKNYSPFHISEYHWNHKKEKVIKEFQTFVKNLENQHSEIELTNADIIK